MNQIMALYKIKIREMENTGVCKERVDGSKLNAKL